MSHPDNLTYVVAAYVIAVSLIAGFATAAAQRLARARRRLAAVDPRGRGR